MNISVFSSEAFFKGAKIMLCSFLECNNFEKHNIFIVTADLKKSSFDKFNNYIQKKYKQNLQMLRLNNIKNEFLSSRHFGVAGYHKLYAFKHLPQKFDRIMSLDSDMIVKKSLKEFYYQDFEGKALIACEDKGVLNNKTDYYEKLGIKDNEPYYNMGCVVFNLDVYLNMYSEQDYVGYINKNSDKVIHAVQDVINVLFKNDIKKADYRIYNNQFRYHQELSDDEQRFVESKTAIIHYVEKVKPWNYRFRNKFLVQYVYDVMKKNNMKLQYYVLRVLNSMFLVTRKVYVLFKEKN